VTGDVNEAYFTRLEASRNDAAKSQNLQSNYGNGAMVGIGND